MSLYQFYKSGWGIQAYSQQAFTHRLREWIRASSWTRYNSKDIFSM